MFPACGRTFPFRRRPHTPAPPSNIPTGNCGLAKRAPLMPPTYFLTLRRESWRLCAEKREKVPHRLHHGRYNFLFLFLLFAFSTPPTRSLDSLVGRKHARMLALSWRNASCAETMHAAAAVRCGAMRRRVKGSRSAHQHISCQTCRKRMYITRQIWPLRYVLRGKGEGRGERGLSSETHCVWEVARYLACLLRTGVLAKSAEVRCWLFDVFHLRDEMR